MMRYSIADLNSALLDQPLDSRAPSRKIIILSPPRTGSSMLCRSMLNAGIGVPHEYFNELFVSIIGTRWGIQGVERPTELSPEAIQVYVRTLLARRTRNGVFAAKVQHKHFRLFLRNAMGEALLDGAALIYLTRKDVLAQAVSLHFAEISGKWDFDGTILTRPHSDQNYFDFDAIDTYLGEILAEQSLWEYLFFTGLLRPWRITYEELSNDPARTLRDLAEFAGFPANDLRLDYDDGGPHSPDPSGPSKREVMDAWRRDRKAQSGEYPSHAIVAADRS